MASSKRARRKRRQQRAQRMCLHYNKEGKIMGATMVEKRPAWWKFSWWWLRRRVKDLLVWQAHRA